MAKSGGKKPDNPNEVIADGEPLDLKNRHFAALLAWLIPGAGHAYQGRYLKSSIFSLSIFFCFAVGMIMSNSKCVYACWDGTEKRWHYFLQVGAGIPALPAAYQAWAKQPGGAVPFGKFMLAPTSVRQLDQWHEKTASGFDMGTLYTMIAGLLNILVVYDAYAGPLPPPVSQRRKGTPDDDPTPDKPGEDDTKRKKK